MRKRFLLFDSTQNDPYELYIQKNKKLGSMGKIFSNLLRNITALRVICVAVSLLFIPAFQYGFVSIWLISFSVCIALRFRLGLIQLNKELVVAENIIAIKHRTHFCLLSLECIAFTAIALGLFFQLYVKNIWSWPEFTEFRFDNTINFFKVISSVSMFDIVDPRSTPSLYIISLSNILAHFVFGAVILIAGKQRLMSLKLTFTSMFSEQSLADKYYMNKDYLLRMKGLCDLLFIFFCYALCSVTIEGAYKNLFIFEAIIFSCFFPYLMVFLITRFLSQFVAYCSSSHFQHSLNSNNTQRKK